MLKLFNILFVFIFTVPLAHGVTPSKETQRKYLKKISPSIVQLWDNNVIVLAQMLIKSNASFNSKKLAVTIEINIKPNGKVASTNLVTSSGNDPFDDTALAAVSSLPKFSVPPATLLSDDGLVHIFWTLKRVKPYSSIEHASIRFVKYTTPHAIANFLAQGLVNKAWKRLLSEVKSKGLKKKSLDAFIRGILLNKLNPNKISSSNLNTILKYYKIGIMPPQFVIPWLQNLNDETLFKDIVSKVAKSSPSLLVEIFKRSMKYSESRSITVFEILVTKDANKYFDRKLLSLIQKSSFKGLKLIAIGAKIKKYKVLDVGDRTKLELAFKGTAKVMAAKAMGVSGRSEFFKLLKSEFSITKSKKLKIEIIKSISRLSNKKAGFSLLGYLKSKSVTQRSAALDGILEFNGEQKEKVWKFSTWELGPMVSKEPTIKMRCKAAEVMIKITQRNLSSVDNKHYFFVVLRTKNPRVLSSAVSAISPFNPLARKKLISFLSHRDLTVVYAAAKQLNLLKSDKDVSLQLAKLLNSKNKNLKVVGIAHDTKVGNLKFQILSNCLTCKYAASGQLYKSNSNLLHGKIFTSLISKKQDSIFSSLIFLFGMRKSII
jgi:TonB family protein